VEEAEGPESGGAGAEVTGAAGVDPVAVALALGGASREEADAFLREQRAVLHNQKSLIDEQTKLTQLQAKELSHELGLRHWSLWVRHSSGVLKLMLELAVGLLLLALVAGISLMVWNAAHADGLIIESFSVPPELAARGLNGQVVASKTLDELTTIQNALQTVRAAKSFANNWGDDIKVEIPDTGVSVGEAYRFLKNWLGHETHISGEVYRTATGIAITARVSGDSGATVTGSEADLDTLVQKMAGKIYGRTQPYRYAVYLNTHGRIAEAIPIFRELALNGPARERPWGYIGWSNSVADRSGASVRASLLEQAVAQQPDNLVAMNNLISARLSLGQAEEALRLERQLQSVLQRGNSGGLVDPGQIPALGASSRAALATQMGAFHESAVERANAMAISGPRANLQSSSFVLAQAEASAHDLAAARLALADPFKDAGIAPGSNAQSEITAHMVMASEAEDWSGVLSQAKRLDPLMLEYPGVRASRLTEGAPLIAYAQARLGDFAAAERTIAPTPDYCYPCLRARARIAELRGQHTRADWWVARAIAAAPSVPFAYADWGHALLTRGQSDAAIAKFDIANQKGPHFADPLELWGEALMAKNQSHLALAKFEEAEKYAPNWGRLHLKWGEALVYAGKPADAKAQFARAAALDLTPSEKSELQKRSAIRI
jgi:hypothetical protein